MKHKSEALVLAFLAACFAIGAYTIATNDDPSEVICVDCG